MGQLRLSPANQDIVILPRILQIGGVCVCERECVFSQTVVCVCVCSVRLQCVCVCVCVCVFSLRQDCCPPGSSCPWKFPGKITGLSCHFLQGIFPTQGWNPKSPMSPALAGRFFTAEQMVHTSIKY